MLPERLLTYEESVLSDLWHWTQDPRRGTASAHCVNENKYEEGGTCRSMRVCKSKVMLEYNTEDHFDRCTWKDANNGLLIQSSG